MKDPRFYLAHVLDCLNRIEKYTKNGREAFFAEKMIQDAVIRNLEVIGEAAKRVAIEFRKEHPEIPWRGMTALRDVLIHDYAGVDLNQVWQVVERELKPLKTAVKKFLPPIKQLELEISGKPVKNQKKPKKA
jgi:uncharacterized protein with HEPN domain